MSINLTKIGVFFDGSFFHGVSSYYLNQHARRSRIALSGIRDYAAHHVALEERVEPRHCRIVESHFFAGRMNSYEARERDGTLFRDRLWDEILQKEDVTAHYMPMGLRGEKGIDVSLALECYELVTLKGLDVVVLVTGDGDFVPLVRKLNALGVRVMVFGCTYSFLDNTGRERGATVSRYLLNEATYPVVMHELIDGYATLPDAERALIDGLFLKKAAESEEASELAATPAAEATAAAAAAPAPQLAAEASFVQVETRHAAHAVPAAIEPAALQPARARQPVVEGGPPASRDSLERLAKSGFANGAGAKEPPAQDRRITGRVIRVLDGYGFIQSDVTDETPFFHHSEVAKRGFDHIQPGTPVSFIETQGDRGKVAKSVQLLDEAA
jgi:cold shock CspA family protein